jgi:hypothetical protein
MLRAVLLLSAALAFGAAIGLVDPGTRTGCSRPGARRSGCG